MAWFKNLSVYRLNGSVFLTDLLTALQTRQFAPCTDLQPQSAGFVPPYADDGELVHAIPGGHFFFALGTEKKSLPKQAIDRRTRDRCREQERQQGFKPGRKQTKEIREQVVDELLPRALTTHSVTRVWVDTVGGWLGIDTASSSRCNDVTRALLRAYHGFPIDLHRYAKTPVACMTQWLLDGEAPDGFTVDDAAELRRIGQGKVRYIKHSLDGSEMHRHIAGGKHCAQLALTWNDKISFTLADDGALKSIRPLDVLTEVKSSTDDADRLETDLALMSGEFRHLLDNLTFALGGRVVDVEAAA